MTRLPPILVALTLAVAVVAHAEQPAQRGGPMRPGVMTGMHHEMLELRRRMGAVMRQMETTMAAGQPSPQQMKEMADMMNEMGNLMGDMASMREGARPAARMPDMSKMMDRMAGMQKRMSEMLHPGSR